MSQSEGARRRSVAEIRAELEQERATLLRHADFLRDRLVPGRLAGTALDLVAATAGAPGRALGRGMKDHPLAVALAGIGLSWLTRSGRRRDAAAQGLAAAVLHDAAAGPAGDPSDDDWARDVRAARRRARAALHRADAARGTPQRRAARRAAIIATLTDETTRALRLGLDDLSPRAQDRIAAAREAACRAEETHRKTQPLGARLIEDHPILAPVLAAALGAALASLWPAQVPADPVPVPRAKGQAGGTSPARRAVAAKRTAASRKPEAALSGKSAIVRRGPKPPKLPV